MDNKLLAVAEDLPLENDIQDSEDQFQGNYNNYDSDMLNQATGMKLGVANMTSPETATTWADLSKRMNLPVDFISKLDNTKLRKTPSTKGLSTFLQNHILKSDPNDVAQFADDLAAVDNVYTAFSEEAEPSVAKLRAATKWLSDRGYNWSDVLESYTKDGVAAEADIDPYEGFGEEEKKFLQGVNESLKKGLDLDDVAYGLPSMSKTLRAKALAMMNEAKQNELAVANTLTMYYGSEWTNWSKETLSRKMKELTELHGVSFPEIRLENIMNGGLADVDYSRIFNLFGAMDVAEAIKLTTLPTGSDLANINEASSIDDLVNKYRVLSMLSEEQRDLKTGASIVQGIVEALPYMAEFALTLGTSAPESFASKTGIKAGTKVAKRFILKDILEQGGFTSFSSGIKALGTKEGYRAIGKAVGNVLKWEAQKLPLYIGKATAEGAKEVFLDEKMPLYFVDESGVKTEVPEKTIDEFEAAFLTAFAKSMLRTFNANVSEWGGEFLPGFHILPKGVRKKLFGHFMDTAGSAGKQYLRRSIMDAIPLSSMPSEVMEEYLNNLFDWGYTETAKEFGIKPINLDMPHVFNGWKEFLQITAVTTALTGGGNVTRLAQNLYEAHGVMQWLDAHQKVLDAIRNTKLNDRSPDQADRVITQPAIAAALAREGGDRMLSLDAEGVEALYQSSPEAKEFLEKAGINEKLIARAKERSSLITINESMLLQAEVNEKPAETTPDGKKATTIGEKLLGNLVVVAGLKLSDVRKMSLGDDVVAAIKEFEQRQEEYRQKAYEAVHKVANLSRLSEESISGFTDLVSSVCATISFHSGTKEDADKIIDNCVYVLSGQDNRILDVSDEARAVLEKYGLVNLLAGKASAEERMRDAAKRREEKEKEEARKAEERRIRREISENAAHIETSIRFGLDSDLGIQHGSVAPAVGTEAEEETKKEKEIKDAQIFVNDYFKDQTADERDKWFKAKTGILWIARGYAEKKLAELQVPSSDIDALATKALAYAIRKYQEKGGAEAGNSLPGFFSMKFSGVVRDYYREKARKNAFQNSTRTLVSRNNEEKSQNLEDFVADPNKSDKPGYTGEEEGFDAQVDVEIPRTSVDRVPYNLVLERYLEKLSQDTNPLYASLFPVVYLRYVEVLRKERSILGKHGEEKSIMTTTEAADLMKPVKEEAEVAKKEVKAAEAELKKMKTDVKTATKEYDKAKKAAEKYPENETLKDAADQAEINLQKLSTALAQEEKKVTALKDRASKKYGSWMEGRVSTDRKNMKEVIDVVSAQAKAAVSELIDMVRANKIAAAELKQLVPEDRIKKLFAKSKEDYAKLVLDDFKEAVRLYKSGMMSRARIACETGWLFDNGGWFYECLTQSPMFSYNENERTDWIFAKGMELSRMKEVFNYGKTILFGADEMDVRAAAALLKLNGTTLSELKESLLDVLIKTFPNELRGKEFLTKEFGDKRYDVAMNIARDAIGNHMAAFDFASRIASGEDPFAGKSTVKTTLGALFPNLLQNNRWLFKMYPELTSVPVVFEQNYNPEEKHNGGYFSRWGDQFSMVVFETSDMKSSREDGKITSYLGRINFTIHHEVQHAIDAIEGLYEGASEKVVVRWVEENPDDPMAKMVEGLSDTDMYKALHGYFAGEIRANYAGNMTLWGNDDYIDGEKRRASTLKDNDPLVMKDNHGPIRISAEEAEKFASYSYVPQDMLFQTIRQAITSAGTSINAAKLPIVFSKVQFQPGTVNLDIGGGRFDNAIEFLAKQGVRNMVFDPYNRSSANNRAIYEEVRNGGVDTVTVSNVLNVIAEKESRSNVIRQAARALKPGGRAYITVYEGKRNGIGGPVEHKPDQWQANRVTKDYIPEIQEHFHDVAMLKGSSGKVIVAWNPINDGVQSQWLMEVGGEPELYQLVFEDNITSHPYAVPEAMEALEEAKKLFESGADNAEVFERTGWQKYHGELVYRIENPENAFTYDKETLSKKIEQLNAKREYAYTAAMRISRGRLSQAEYVYACNYLGISLPEYVINAKDIGFEDAVDLWFDQRVSELFSAICILEDLFTKGKTHSYAKDVRLTDIISDTGGRLAAMFPDLGKVKVRLDFYDISRDSAGGFDRGKSLLTITPDPLAPAKAKLSESNDTLNHEASHVMHSRRINGANYFIAEAWSALHPDDPRAYLPNEVIYALFLGEIVANLSEYEKENPSIYEDAEAKYIENLRQEFGLSQSVDLSPIVMTYDETEEMVLQYQNLLAEIERLQKEAEEAEERERLKERQERRRVIHLRKKLKGLEEELKRLREAEKQYNEELHIQERGALPRLISEEEWKKLHERNVKEQERRESLSEIQRLKEDVRKYQKWVAQERNKLSELEKRVIKLREAEKEAEEEAKKKAEEEAKKKAEEEAKKKAEEEAKQKVHGKLRGISLVGEDSKQDSKQKSHGKRRGLGYVDEENSKQEYPPLDLEQDHKIDPRPPEVYTEDGVSIDIRPYAIDDSPEDLDWDEDYFSRYKGHLQEKQGKVRGSYTKMESYRMANEKAKFDESYAAIIRLVRGNADASTLFHEGSHHIYMCLESMVRMGLTDSWLAEQVENVERWLDEKGEELLKTNPEMTEEELSRAKKEMFATAFEMYMMEGHTANPNLKHTFGVMRKILYGIYNGELMNIGTHPELLSVDINGERTLDPEIKTIFDGFMATEEILDKQDFIREWADALKDSFGTLLSGNLKELEGLRRMFQLADSDVANKVGELKDKAIRALIPVWRKDIIKSYEERRDVKVAKSIREKGGFSTRSIIDIMQDDGSTAINLYVKGIAKMRGGTVDPRVAAFENGYGTVEEMLTELANVPDARGYLADAIRARKEEYHRSFQDTQSAMTVKSVRDALNYAIDVLERRQDKTRTEEERKMERRAAENGDAILAKLAIDEMKVKDIERDKTFEKSIRYDGTTFVTAFQKGDYALALDKLLSIRKTLKIMENLAKAKSDISRIRTLLKIAPRKKRGNWMDGDFHSALAELSFYFKFSSAQPKILDKNYRNVALGRTEDEGLENINREFPDFLFATTETDYRSLTFGEFKQLANMADKLYAEGKMKLKGDIDSWIEGIHKTIGNCVSQINQQKAKFNDLDSSNKKLRDRLRSNAARFFGWGYKLQIFMAKADNFNVKTGPNYKMYEAIQEAYEQVVILEEKINDPVNKNIKELYETMKNMTLPDLAFEGDVALRAYNKWTPEMVLCLCLNMGTELNMKRIRDGFGWADEDIQKVASLLTEAEWKKVQAIWDGLIPLGKAVGDMFRNQNHYDLKMENPKPFSVKTKDGKLITMPGGYYPIRYKFTKSHVEDAESKFYKQNTLMEDFSSTHERGRRGARTPLDLSLNVLIKFIHEGAIYAETRGVMKDTFAVVMNEVYKNAYGKTQSFEQYREMIEILGNIANPSRSESELLGVLERWAKSVMASTALMGNMRSVLMQLTSGTVGLDELGKYYGEAVLHFMGNPIGTIIDVRHASQFMRNRVAYQDSDLRPLMNKFSQTNLQKVREKFSDVGYLMMRSADTLIASVSWYGKYRQEYDRLIAQEIAPNEADKKAKAAADDFVARTQGGNRAIDVTPIQLSKIGSLFAVFFSAVNAQYNTAVMTWGRMVHGDATAGESFAGIVGNCLVPCLLTAFLGFVWAGGFSGYGEGDDDKIQKAWGEFLRELMASPFAGMPIVRDATDYAADKLSKLMTGQTPTLFGSDFLNAGIVSSVNDIFQNATQGTAEALQGNWEKAAWEAADAVGAALQMPAISIYEKIYRFASNQSNELGDALYRPPTKKENKK